MKQQRQYQVQPLDPLVKGVVPKQVLMQLWFHEHQLPPVVQNKPG